MISMRRCYFKLVILFSFVYAFSSILLVSFNDLGVVEALIWFIRLLTPPLLLSFLILFETYRLGYGFSPIFKFGVFALGEPSTCVSPRASPEEWPNAQTDVEIDVKALLRQRSFTSWWNMNSKMPQTTRFSPFVFYLIFAFLYSLYHWYARGTAPLILLCVFLIATAIYVATAYLWLGGTGLFGNLRQASPYVI